jgi:hypothetical protein
VPLRIRATRGRETHGVAVSAPLSETALRQMKLRDLRRYAIDRGYGVRYLSERKKAELIRIILEVDVEAQRFADESRRIAALRERGSSS